jgi:hypothetical protein
MNTLLRWALPLVTVAVTGLASSVSHADADAVARTLAGSAEVVKSDGERGPVLRRHAVAMQSRWDRFDTKVGEPLSTWAGAALAQPESGRVFYPFSGPDFGTVHRVYPSGSHYVLAGLEPAGRVPDVTGSAVRLDQLLGIFRKGLSTFVKKGFFGTREMRRSFERKQLVDGITGVLMLFAHHEGFTVRSVRAITIDAGGKVVDGQDWGSVRLELDRAGRSVIVDYFQIDLSDGGLAAHPGHAEFLREASGAATFLKAASHLLQNRGFDTVRDAILNNATSVLQDETGLGFASLSQHFEVRLFGDYRRAHKLFGRRQVALREAYESARPEPLPFKIGYWKVAGSCLQYGHTRR